MNKVWVTFKVYNKGICFDVVLVSFLLTSNIFYNLFWCSCCWLWTYIFFAGMAVCFISFGACYIFFFNETWSSKSIYLNIPVFYENFLRYYFKNCCSFFSGYFFKNPYDCWHIFMWLQKLTILDMYKRTWLLRDNSNSCWRNSDRTYIYVVGCLNACTTGGCKVRKGLRQCQQQSLCL